jgi:hypothetical protein
MNDEPLDPEPVSSPAVPLMMQLAIERLTKAVGPARALEIMDAALAEMGKSKIETPEELIELSEHLIRQGGLIRAVGRGLKVLAGLQGARASGSFPFSPDRR